MSEQASAEAPLAILCGAGRFPFAVADAVRRRGRKVVLFALRGWADPERIAHYPHHWGGIAQFGRFQRLAKAEGCREVVFIGGVLRPSVWQLRPDLGTIGLLPRVIRLFRGGDDHLLSGVGRIFEEYGFRLVGAHEVAPEILIPDGVLGGKQPNARDLADIAIGLEYIAATGNFDVGQAVVVANRHVLAVEAAEGTDQMLLRVAELRKAGRIKTSAGSGVLVKAPKPQQDRRLDLPSIGSRTVEMAVAAGLAGVAVEAHGAITADLAELIATADRADCFVFGVPARVTWPSS